MAFLISIDDSSKEVLNNSKICLIFEKAIIYFVKIYNKLLTQILTNDVTSE